MTRISVVTSEVLGVAGTGGPGTADSLLAVALARAGHDVELLVAPGRDIGGLRDEWRRTYADARVRVRQAHESHTVRPSFLAPSWHVYNALREEPPDVVVADDWRALPHTSLQARATGRAFPETAFVLYCHGPARVFAEAARKVPDTLDRFGEDVAQRACLELADAVVSPSEWLVGWLRVHRWPDREVHVIQNLRQSDATGAVAEQARHEAPVRRLAFFGQLREGKGLGVFLGALRSLDQAHLDSVAVLFLGHTRRWTQQRLEDALGPTVLSRLASVSVETEFDRDAALAELKTPGTLAVMPSLLENSPYAVAECIEHGIPFVASDVGGTPELVAPDDRARVLVPPTVHAFTTALQAALAHGAEPARPARATPASHAAWLDLVATVVPGRRQQAPLARSDFVLFPAGGDPRLVEELGAAQAASGADVVTAGIREEGGGVRVFLGDPGPLGLVENHYGEVGLVRRSLLDDGVAPLTPWTLFARLALGGAHVVSVPDPLVSGVPRQPVAAERLSVLQAFEQAPDDTLRGFPQLAATLAAETARARKDRARGHRGPGFARRLRRKLLG